MTLRKTGRSLVSSTRSYAMRTSSTTDALSINCPRRSSLSFNSPNNSLVHNKGALVKKTRELSMHCRTKLMTTVDCNNCLPLNYSSKFKSAQPSLSRSVELAESLYRLQPSRVPKTGEKLKFSDLVQSITRIKEQYDLIELHKHSPRIEIMENSEEQSKFLYNSTKNQIFTPIHSGDFLIPPQRKKRGIKKTASFGKCDKLGKKQSRRRKASKQKKLQKKSHNRSNILMRSELQPTGVFQ
mmetsp:Transcript_18703/g.21500  ORF Transcript_18703/g.21500 Transcript_18703/m.21500 type:complete len:240 (-) Transcript_18703:93-812(-)